MFDFPLFPEQASTLAPKVDALVGFIFFVCCFFTLLIGFLIFFFVIKYHHKRDANRQRAQTFDLALEITWTAIPLGLALVIFVWGAQVFTAIRQTPSDAYEVYVVGKQWMWKLQHPEGRA